MSRNAWLKVKGTTHGDSKELLDIDPGIDPATKSGPEPYMIHIEFDRARAISWLITITDRLVEEGIGPSVGSVGEVYDNSLVESQLGLYKSELIHHDGPWRDVDHVEAATAS
ncbi:hypothetical protein G3N18_14465 [Microbacterium sp. 2C]|nr:hypothetical protein [Microbacterium paulum]